MKVLFQAIFLVILMISNVFAQESDVIAEANNSKITSDEFLKRFELTPRVRSSANIDTQKTHFLYTLIAEKLWAEEARSQNLDTMDSYKYYISNLEKLLVRDALFKREIEEKVSISEEEIQKALDKRRYELRLNFLFSKSKSEIDSLYKKLQKTSIDSILQNRSEASEQIEPVKVLFGQMETALEEALFQLEEGEYTKPIFNEIGWVIYYLKEKVELSGTSLGDYNSALREVKQILTNRAKKKLTEKYLYNLLHDVNVNADGDLFQFLSDELSNLLSGKNFPAGTTIYYLYEDDLIKLIESLPENLENNSFVKFANDPVSLKEFTYYLFFNNFKSNGLDRYSVQASLNNAVREFIRSEIISREAYSQNLHLLPEIQNELAMWADNFLSQYLRNTFTKNAHVTNSELEKHISDLSDSLITTKFVSITEVKLKSLEQAHFIFTQMQLGESFEEVIKRMNLPSSSIYESASLEPISNHSELAEIIEDMVVGEVYGPIVRAQGYSIIKLNEIEERVLSPDEKNILQIDNQREILFYKKLEQVLTEETIELARKYNLKVNEAALHEIKVTEIPSLIYRYYGFGGQTVSAPFMNLFYKWFYEYKREIPDAL